MDYRDIWQPNSDISKTQKLDLPLIENCSYDIFGGSDFRGNAL